MKAIRAISIFALSAHATAWQAPPQLDANSIFEHTKAATVVILAGEGAGRLHSIATGVVISRDGVILTALHAVKGAAEVQIRMANGDVFDHVDLLGFDERRDIAALRISAGALPALAPPTAANLTLGDLVYAVTNAGGLTWSATEGIISAIRPAEEVPGAGSGFRLLQFSAPVAPGSSGGALVDRSGALIGIITKGNGPAGFAIPIETVLGLPNSGTTTALGSGVSLQMPAKAAADLPQSSAAIANSDPKQILRNAKTIFVRSKTSFLTVDTLDRALTLDKGLVKIRTHDSEGPACSRRVHRSRPSSFYLHSHFLDHRQKNVDSPRLR